MRSSKSLVQKMANERKEEKQYVPGEWTSLSLNISAESFGTSHVAVQLYLHSWQLLQLLPPLTAD